jgi:hypothetical protein
MQSTKNNMAVLTAVETHCLAGAAQGLMFTGPVVCTPHLLHGPKIE